MPQFTNSASTPAKEPQSSCVEIIFGFFKVSSSITALFRHRFEAENEKPLGYNFKTKALFNSHFKLFGQYNCFYRARLLIRAIILTPHWNWKLFPNQIFCNVVKCISGVIKPRPIFWGKESLKFKAPLMDVYSVHSEENLDEDSAFSSQAVNNNCFSIICQAAFKTFPIFSPANAVHSTTLTPLMFQKLSHFCNPPPYIVFAKCDVFNWI